jgi:hypothetical protein
MSPRGVEAVHGLEQPVEGEGADRKRPPEIHGSVIGYHGAGTAIRIASKARGGPITKVRPTPARLRANVHDAAEGTWTEVAVVIDVLGSEETRDLRMGTVAVSATGLDGASVTQRVLRRLPIRDLELTAVRGWAYNDDASRVTDRQARALLSSAVVAESVADTRARVARAWWEAKVDGRPVGPAVAKARGEGAPGSARAVERGYAYVNRLKERGVLARVGREMGVDASGLGKRAREVLPG